MSNTNQTAPAAETIEPKCDFELSIKGNIINEDGNEFIDSHSFINGDPEAISNALAHSIKLDARLFKILSAAIYIYSLNKIESES